MCIFNQQFWKLLSDSLIRQWLFVGKKPLCVSFCNSFLSQCCLKGVVWFSFSCSARSWRVLSLNGYFGSLCDIIIRRIETVFLTFFLELMSPRIDRLPKRVTIRRVPLQRPSDWFQFLSSIIRVLFLSRISWSGAILNFKVFRNSARYKTSSSSVLMLALHTLSQLRYVPSSPRIMFIIKSFNSWTISIFGVNIARSF